MMFIGTWLYLFSTFHVTENFIWLSELKKVWKKRLKKIQRNRRSWQSTKWLTSHWAIYNWWVPPKTRTKKKGKRISQYLESHASISHLWEQRKIICQHVTKSHVNYLRAVQYNRTLNQIYDGTKIIPVYVFSFERLHITTLCPSTNHHVFDMSSLFSFFFLGLTSRKWWRIAWFRISWKYFLGSSFLKVWNHPYPPAWTD